MPGQKFLLTRANVSIWRASDVAMKPQGSSPKWPECSGFGCGFTITMRWWKYSDSWTEETATSCSTTVNSASLAKLRGTSAAPKWWKEGWESVWSIMKHHEAPRPQWSPLESKFQHTTWSSSNCHRYHHHQLQLKHERNLSKQLRAKLPKSCRTCPQTFTARRCISSHQDGP